MGKKPEKGGEKKLGNRPAKLSTSAPQLCPIDSESQLLIDEQGDAIQKGEGVATWDRGPDGNE
jgi:hypothetical protein